MTLKVTEDLLPSPDNAEINDSINPEIVDIKTGEKITNIAIINPFKIPGPVIRLVMF